MPQVVNTTPPPPLFAEAERVREERRAIHRAAREGVAPGWTVSPQAAHRARGLNAQVLERLRQGPATNRELTLITGRFGARIFDLRNAGAIIETRERRASGEATYRLIGWSAPRNNRGAAIARELGR